MNGHPEPEQASVIAVAAAVQFIAEQHGGVERALGRHHRLPDGLCSGCLTTLTPWPCPVAGFALLAKEHPSYRRWARQTTAAANGRATGPPRNHSTIQRSAHHVT